MKLNPDTQVVATLGSQGRLRQHGAGHHRAGRRGAGAQPDLSDPLLRLHHEWRRRALDAGRAERGFHARARSRRAPLDPQADRAGAELPGQPDRLHGDARFLQGSRRSTARSTTSSSSPISPMPRSISTTRCRPRCSRCRAPSTSPSSSPRCRKTYSMPGWRVGFAVGNERLIAALARVKSYLDYGAFTPDPGGRRRRAQRRRTT